VYWAYPGIWLHELGFHNDSLTSVAVSLYAERINMCHPELELHVSGFYNGFQRISN
jgi:hypothetical protein